MIQRLQRVISVLLLTVVLALSFNSPSFAASSNVQIQGLISRLNVSNLERSIEFYGTKLGLIRNNQYDTPEWTQFYVFNFANSSPDNKYILEIPQIGLFQAPYQGSNRAVATIVVSDIKAYRDYLMKQDVAVGEITTIEHGIKLAFFLDPDGNRLGIRQNP